MLLKSNVVFWQPHKTIERKFSEGVLRQCSPRKTEDAAGPDRRKSGRGGNMSVANTSNCPICPKAGARSVGRRLQRLQRRTTGIQVQFQEDRVGERGFVVGSTLHKTEAAI